MRPFSGSTGSLRVVAHHGPVSQPTGFLVPVVTRERGGAIPARAAGCWRDRSPGRDGRVSRGKRSGQTDWSASDAGRSAATGGGADRRDPAPARGAGSVHGQADRAAPDLRRPGGDRDRERAPVQRAPGAEPRADRGARAADGHRRDPAGHLQLADGRPAGVRRHHPERRLAVRGRQGLSLPVRREPIHLVAHAWRDAGGTRRHKASSSRAHRGEARTAVPRDPDGSHRPRRHRRGPGVRGRRRSCERGFAPPCPCPCCGRAIRSA